MHYYQFNIGDYKSHTEHLSEMEDLTYRRMLDWYYLHEKPFPTDYGEIARLIRMRSHIDCIAVVLHEFFDLADGGWIHHRANAEIAKAGDKSNKASESAKARWNKVKDANALPTQSESNATQDTLPITHNTEHKVKTQRGSRLDPNFLLPESWAMFCIKTRPELSAVDVWEQFRDYWIAQPGQKGVKTDWEATWRNWVRRQNAPKVAPADIARTTVPGTKERDPALVKLDEDRKRAAPPSLEVLAKMAALRKQA